MLEAFVPVDPDSAYPYGVGVVIAGLKRRSDTTSAKGEREVDSRDVCGFISKIVGGLPTATMMGLT
eukprot:4799432-Alexandrium_andersonii.AAC.1